MEIYHYSPLVSGVFLNFLNKFVDLHILDLNRERDFDTNMDEVIYHSSDEEMNTPEFSNKENVPVSNLNDTANSAISPDLIFNLNGKIR